MHEMFTSYAKVSTPNVLDVQGSLKLDGVPAVALVQAESH